MKPSRRPADRSGFSDRPPISRRRMIGGTAAAAAAAALAPRLLRAAEKVSGALVTGTINGEPTAGKIGAQVPADGGNAVDAIVAGALAAAIASPAMTGIDGLGLTLGHGMSRFEPRAGHPNSPGPGKRPLHNMCPTIGLRDGRPILALGGRGGRQIPNGVFETLAQFAGLDRSMADAVAAPRVHTEGGVELQFEKAWPAADLNVLTRIGYRVKSAASATISGVSFNPKTHECLAAMR